MGLDRKYVILSLLGHCAIVIPLFFSSGSNKPLVELEATGMNVMWADVTMSPPKTPEYKLPGPEIKQVPKTADAAPKYVTTPANEPAPAKKKDKTQTSQKAMADALASLNLEEDVEVKPTPKLDNFASIDGAEKEGIPTSQYGGGSENLVKNPEFLVYQREIKSILEKNLVWLKETALRSEVRFRMDREGNIIEPSIEKGSGDPSFDQAALRAVRKSSPLPAPPAKYKDQILREEFVIRFKR